MATDQTDSAKPLSDDEREVLLKAVGGSVAKAREAAGQTLAATAKRAGITKDYLWRLEKGRQTVSILTLAGIAVATGTTVYAILAAAKREEASIRAERAGNGS